MKSSPHSRPSCPPLDRAYVRRNLVEMFGEDDERVRFWDETVASQRLPDEG